MLRLKFRFSLRTLLILVTVAAIGSAYFGSYLRLSRRGMREAKEKNRAWIYVTEAELQSSAVRTRHAWLKRFFAPANWLEHQWNRVPYPGAVTHQWVQCFPNEAEVAVILEGQPALEGETRAFVGGKRISVVIPKDAAKIDDQQPEWRPYFLPLNMDVHSYWDDAPGTDAPRAKFDVVSTTPYRLCDEFELALADRRVERDVQGIRVIAYFVDPKTLRPVD